MTAEEIYRKETGCVMNHGDIKKAMIEFAKYHVEQALKAASENAKIKERKTIHSASSGTEYSYKKVIDKQSILNAYPLTDIK